MNKKLLIKIGICAGVFIGGIALTTLTEAPKLAPVVTVLVVIIWMNIDTKEKEPTNEE